MKINFAIRSLLPIFLLAALTGCGTGGGGGGGDAFVGAAKINVSVSPNNIDTDDRARVTLRIQDVIDTGIILKVRYSPKISYAAATARLKLDSESDSIAITPSVTAETTDYKYLVFFLKRSLFGDLPSEGEELKSEPATLTFEITGDGRLSNGAIEADADVNDPAVPDDTEFDVASPGFEAETEATINVEQSRS